MTPPSFDQSRRTNTQRTRTNRSHARSTGDAGTEMPKHGLVGKPQRMHQE